MDKRDKFIAELRDEARKKGLPFKAEKWRGKGRPHDGVHWGSLDHGAVARDRSKDGKENQETTRVGGLEERTMAMKAYAYRALFEPGNRRSNVVVTFPDVPEVITQGRGQADARAMAEEALGLALLAYLECGKPLPKARAKGRDLVEISVAPDVAAKLAVLESFAAAGITKSELARRIGKDEKEVRRILDPKHPTKLPALTVALRALGKRLVVGVTEAEAA
jgi:antitoxin HicB